MDPLPPASTPAPLPPKRGGCCCAGGCATMLAISFIGMTLLTVAAWYFCGKALSTFTSTAPTEIKLEMPSEPQFAAANAKLEQMHAAATRNEAGTFEFTAADLNALIARHPKFKDLRNRVRVAIDNSIMTLDVSAPLSSTSIPGLGRRWFNGRATLGLSYDDGNFDFALRSLTTNGRSIPLSVLPAIGTTFDQTISDTVRKSRRQDSADEEMWEHIQSLKTVDDKLVVTTKGTSRPTL